MTATLPCFSTRLKSRVVAGTEPSHATKCRQKGTVNTWECKRQRSQAWTSQAATLSHKANRQSSKKRPATRPRTGTHHIRRQPEDVKAGKHDLAFCGANAAGAHAQTREEGQGMDGGQNEG